MYSRTLLNISYLEPEKIECVGRPFEVKVLVVLMGNETMLKGRDLFFFFGR